MDAGSDIGMDAGSDTGMDAGSDTGMDTGSDTGMDTGSDTGMDTGSDTGMDTDNIEQCLSIEDFFECSGCLCDLYSTECEEYTDVLIANLPCGDVCGNDECLDYCQDRSIGLSEECADCWDQAAIEPSAQQSFERECLMNSGCSNYVMKLNRCL